jgi:hypothetical protein
MSLQSVDIQGFEGGVNRSKKPFLITDDAFVNLFNAYCWRGEIKLFEGIKLLGRLRRFFEEDSIGNSAASPWTFNLFTLFTITETEAQIEPGSVFITIQDGPDIEFTDEGNGILSSPTIGNSGTINYISGDVTLVHTAGASPTLVTFGYFPGLPVMGIDVREQADLNQEQTIFFDTTYAYIHNGADFIEYIPGTTWNGSNSDFFWSTNYRGADAADRLFFTTNFFLNAGSPMRYTDGTTWEDFTPILAASTANETFPDVVTPWTAYSDTLTNLPIVEGSIVITVGALTFRDTPQDGTLVSTGTNSGTIDYSTGAFTLSFNPALGVDTPVTATYEYGTSFLYSARVLIPYYGRLLALNVWEGATIGGARNVFARCRFSQIGNPVEPNAWRTDIFGRGGFVDAPVAEEIVSARFYKNTLIVQFERSTWRLQYIGEYGAPFVWERISSDWGAESTFSTVLFDSGVLAIGDKAIVASTGVDVQRVDLQIPDHVYRFQNASNGPERVHAVRDFEKELVYWCYPDFGTLESSDQVFPNRILIYNYRNNTFAFARANVTVFGFYQYPAGATWDRSDILWDSDIVTWDDSTQTHKPTPVSGNQKGFCHFFASADVETAADSLVNARNQESLFISAVTVNPGDVRLTITDHNLAGNEWIYVAGLIYLVAVPDPAPGSTSLNNEIYQINVIDKDTIQLKKWDLINENAYLNFTVESTGDYIGGGVAALFPSPNIRTKDFNPAKIAGQNIQTSYIDFLLDSTPNAQFSVNVVMNTGAYSGNLTMGNSALETSQNQSGYIFFVTQANPAVISSLNHGLLNDMEVTIQGVGGMTQINNQKYRVTFIDSNTFSVNIDSSAFSGYTGGGYWIRTDEGYFPQNTIYSWHRFFANTFGQYMGLEFSYSGNQMSQFSTHQQNFVLNALKIYFRAAGKNIFGR